MSLAFCAAIAASPAGAQANFAGPAYSPQHCEASWYGPGFVGNTTASGSVYTGEGGTAAHPYLPFETVLLVESVYGQAHLTVTDRGPYAHGRCLDVSQGSAWIVGYGIAPVKITPVY